MRELTQLQAELKAMQDHDDTLAKTANAEKQTIKENIQVSKTSVIPNWREWLPLSFHFSLFSFLLLSM